jgi:hypothetical protein
LKTLGISLSAAESAVMAHSAANELAASRALFLLGLGRYGIQLF